jgi:hypothetical protein
MAANDKSKPQSYASIPHTHTQNEERVTYLRKCAISYFRNHLHCGSRIKTLPLSRPRLLALTLFKNTATQVTSYRLESSAIIPVSIRREKQDFQINFICTQYIYDT